MTLPFPQDREWRIGRRRFAGPCANERHARLQPAGRLRALCGFVVFFDS